MYNEEEWQLLSQRLKDLLEANFAFVELVHLVQLSVQELELEHTYTSNMNSHNLEEAISSTNLQEELS